MESVVKEGFQEEVTCWPRPERFPSPYWEEVGGGGRYISERENSTCNGPGAGKDTWVTGMERRHSDWNLETHSAFGEMGSTRSCRPWTVYFVAIGGSVCMCVSRFSHVRLFENTWTAACQASQSMGFSKQVLLEWVAISSSRGSSRPRDSTKGVSGMVGGFFTAEPLGKPRRSAGQQYDLICI